MAWNDPRIDLVKSAALCRARDRERRWQRRLELGLHSGAVGPVVEDHVDLVDTVTLLEKLLSRGQVHHGELTVERRCDTSRREQPSDGEAIDAAGGRERDDVAGTNAVRGGELRRQEDRPGIDEGFRNPSAVRERDDLIAIEIVFEREVGAIEL